MRNIVYWEIKPLTLTLLEFYLPRYTFLVVLAPSVLFCETYHIYFIIFYDVQIRLHKPNATIIWTIVSYSKYDSEIWKKELLIGM